MSADPQSEAILSGLRELEVILERPLADRALDLSENAATARHKEMLRRLKNSLVQFVERRGDLVYVAFIGHFSSGKSSTINSLLGLWQTKRARLVDLNPTDKVITLITHDANANSVLGIVNQGSVPTHLETVEHEFLRQLVLVDTPGTGDPHLMEEMARDFLPVCDLVLFFLSATNPLDSSDKPLLSELHKRLPFIPMLFVITRADELRLKPSKPLSANNFNLTKAAVFVGDLMSRITLLLKTAPYEENQFLLLDNKANFQIEKLKDELLRKVDPSKMEARLSMHYHKVQFFRETAEQLRDFFSSFLDLKLKELSTIVAAASKNIERYEQVVGISNANLTKSWFERHSMIQDLNTKSASRLRPFTELPESLFSLSSVSKVADELRSHVAQHSKAVAERVERHVMQTAFLELKSQFGNAVRNVSNLDLDTLLPEGHGIVPGTLAWTLGDSPIIPTAYLSAKADEQRKAVRESVLNYSVDKLSLQELQRLIQQGYMVDKCVDIVNAAQGSLARDVDSYFQNVSIYRSGVFSMHTKESISKLGIARQLDQLETEFTDEDKESIQIKVKRALFPQSTEVTAALTTRLSNISERVGKLLGDLANFEISTPIPLQLHIEQRTVELQPSMVAEIQVGLQKEADELVTDVQTRLAGNIAEILEEYEADITIARKEQRLSYLLAILGGGALTLFIYAGYRWLLEPAGQSRLQVVFWALVANAVGDLAGYLWIRLRDHFPRTKRQIQHRHIAVLRERFRSSIADAVEGLKFQTLTSEGLGARLNKVYASLSSLPQDAWQAEVDNRYNQLSRWSREVADLRKTYIEALDNFAKSCSQYFEDTQKNLDTLKHTAKSIHEQAIEPSFTLLEQTRGELEALKDELREIAFS